MFCTEGARAGEGVGRAFARRLPPCGWNHAGKTGCREGKAPAEPHPCGSHCADHRCFAKSPAIAHSTDQPFGGSAGASPWDGETAREWESWSISLFLSVDVSSAAGCCRNCWSHAISPRRKGRTEGSNFRHFQLCALAPLREVRVGTARCPPPRLHEIRETISSVLNTVSPSQPRPPSSSPVLSQDSKELQDHWASAHLLSLAPWDVFSGQIARKNVNGRLHSDCFQLFDQLPSQMTSLAA